MNSKILLIAFGLICTVVAGKDKGGWMCNGVEVKLTETEAGIIKTCVKEMMERKKAEKKEKKEEKKDKDEKKEMKMDPCLTACKYEKLKIVVNGKLDNAALDKFLGTAFSKTDGDALKKSYHACNAEVKNTLSTDKKCESYDELSKCHLKALFQTCIPPKREKKEKA